MKKITLNLRLNNCPSVDETVNVIRYINLLINRMHSYRAKSIELHESSYNGEVERCLVIDMFAVSPELEHIYDYEFMYYYMNSHLSHIAEIMNQDCIAYAIYGRDDLNSPWEFQHGNLVWNYGKNITDKMDFDLTYFKETVG